MNLLRIRLALIAVLLLLPATALVCISAPSLPGEAKLGDDVLSLAHITEVALDIQPLTRRLRDRGMSAAKIAAVWSETLADAGIHVADDDGKTPVLRLETKASVEEGLTGICFASYLKVLQPVHVPRLDRTLMVPTYVYVMGGMDSEQALSDTATAALNILLNGFVDRVALATARVEREAEE